jgi:N-acetylmuramoyl-L-alanine amidase
MGKAFRFCLMLLAWMLVPAMDALAGQLVSIEVVSRQETITIVTNYLTPHKVFTLSNPDRLVVDVPAVPGHPHVALPSGYNGKLITQARFGQFNPQTSRFVFDLSQPVRVMDIDKGELKNGRLVIGITPLSVHEARDEIETEKVWPKAEKNINVVNTETPVAKEKPVKAEKEIMVEKPVKAEIAEKPVKVEKAEKAEKIPAIKKARLPVVVIDPGHGGIDPGTRGRNGTYEKDMVLAYARLLKVKLLKTGRYRVVLTRNGDELVALRNRVDIARKAGADIFLSLHADSAPQAGVRGLSVYTVSEKASDQEAEALAARENKSDVLTGVDLSDERKDVAGILISLAERETKNHSATLADTLVSALDDKVHLLSNTHRFAGFAVLKAPDVPSVLIEIGFLSHSQEEKLIKSKAYREKVTSGIAAGIDRYFRQEKRMGDE